MDLNDKAFYGPKKVEEPAPTRRVLTAEELFDTIVRVAQDDSRTAQMTLVRCPKCGGSFHAPVTVKTDPAQRDVFTCPKCKVKFYKGAEFKVAQEDDEDGDEYRCPGCDAITYGPGKCADCRKKEAQVSNPINPTPGIVDNQMPVQDKVQQFKDLGLNDQQIEQVMKVSSDGTQPAGTGADGQYAPLSKEEVPGTGLIANRQAQQDWDEINQIQNAPVPSQPTQPATPPSTTTQPPVEEKKDVRELMSPEKSAEEKKRVLISFMSYVHKLHNQWMQLSEEINELKVPGSGKGNPASKADLKALAAEKKVLRRKLSGLQVQISRAGGMWKRLINLFGEEQIPKNELLLWLAEMQEQMAGRPDRMLEPPSTAPQMSNDQYKQFLQKSIEEQKKEIEQQKNKSIKEQVEEQKAKGKKEGQMAPPGGQPSTSPAQPPAPGVPSGGSPEGIGMDPGLVEEKEEDPRSLEEILEDLEKDVEAITEKIEKGETMSGGQELTPVTTDTGADPAPPAQVAKEAVDSDAKEYYQDYWGEYGTQLTEDRVAEIVDIIEETAKDYGVVLNKHQVSRIATILDDSPISPLVGILDRHLVNYLLKTGMAYHIHDFTEDSEFWNHMREAVNSTLPNDIREKIAAYGNFTKSAYIKKVDGQWGVFSESGKLLGKHKTRGDAEKQLQAIEINKHKSGQKMKQPKINEQQDDALKVEDSDDKADSEEVMLARPAHLYMEVEDQEVDGAYLKLTISWDSDEEAACRSDDGLKQAVLSFVKGLESQKEFIDYGFLGQISFDEFDPEGGLAVVSVRTKKPGDAPTHIKTTPKKSQLLSKPQPIGPVSKQLLDSGLIRVENGIYLGTAADGQTVQLGNVGRENQLEQYLRQNPTPAQW